MIIRSFVGLSLSSSSTEKLSQAANTVRALYAHDNMHFIAKENFHLTLAFLGNQDKLTLETLAENIDNMDAKAIYLDKLAFEHITYFPFSNKPKVLAAIAKPNLLLNQLHGQVTSLLPTNINVKKEKKFAPHISIARIKRNTKQLHKIFYGFDTTLTCTDLAIYESRPHPKGRRYQALYTWAVAGEKVIKDKSSSAAT